MADFYAKYPVVIGTSAAGVSSLNSLMGAINIVAGSNITVTPSGSSITISATGGGGGSGNVNYGGDTFTSNQSLGSTNAYGLNLITNNISRLTISAAGASVFSGSLAAPTPTYGDNSTQVATTAFVQSAVQNVALNAYWYAVAL